MRCTCGLGDAKYAKIKDGKLVCPHCAGQIVCDAPQPPPPALRCSAEAYAQLGPIVKKQKQEAFWIFYLDARNRLFGKKLICRGTLTMCIVHPRDVFGPAIAHHAVAIILAHNHPSGDPTPSLEDETLTQRLVQAGKMMGIPVMDHLVVGKNTYFSFRDAGRANLLD